MFVPAAQPPHRAGPVASPLDRFAMTALATSHHGPFQASDVELLRTGPSYTVDTIADFLAKGPSSLCLIVGSDTFVEMTGWKDAAGGACGTGWWRGRAPTSAATSASSALRRRDWRGASL